MLSCVLGFCWGSSVILMCLLSQVSCVALFYFFLSVSERFPQSYGPVLLQYCFLVLCFWYLDWYVMERLVFGHVCLELEIPLELRCLFFLQNSEMPVVVLDGVLWLQFLSQLLVLSQGLSGLVSWSHHSVLGICDHALFCSDVWVSEVLTQSCPPDPITFFYWLICWILFDSLNFFILPFLFSSSFSSLKISVSRLNLCSMLLTS